MIAHDWYGLNCIGMVYSGFAIDWRMAPYDVLSIGMGYPIYRWVLVVGFWWFRANRFSFSTWLLGAPGRRDG